MRVQLYDCNRQGWRIDSTSPELVGRWFAEHAGRLMTADARLQDCRIEIWPETHEEHQALTGPGLQYPLDQDGLLALAQAVLNASAKLAEREGSSA